MYWIPKLQNKITKIEASLKEYLKKEETANDLNLIKAELLKERIFYKIFLFNNAI